MLKITISKSDLKEIKFRKKKEKDKKIYRRLQFLHLKHKNKTNKEIADILGVCADTITDWIRIYLNEGLDNLCQPINYDNRSAKIDNYIIKIKQDIEDNTISTLSELQDWIKKKYSLEIEQSWLFRCCKKNSIYLTKKRG